MALSQDTVKEIFVTSGLATETTAKTFQTGASDGELGVFKKDGSNGTSLGDFYMALKIAGSTIISDLYQPSEIERLYAVKGVAAVQKAITIDPQVLTEGTEYLVEIRFRNVGSLSSTNFYSKFGQYIVKSGGETKAQVAAGIIDSLNKNFTSEPGATISTNPYFTISTAAGVITLTAKEQKFDLGRFEGRPLEFDVIVKNSLATVTQTVPGNPGTATGRQVAHMEYFYRGNRGDQFRGQHFPYNYSLATKSSADASAQYSLIEGVAIKQQKEMFNVATGRKEFVIAVPNGTGATTFNAINAIIAKIESVSGVTIADIS